MVISIVQIWLSIGVIFILFEIFFPMIFFLNLALACFIVSFILWMIPLNIVIQTFLFAFFSFVLIFTIRPFLIQKRQKYRGSIEEKYIGHIARVIEDIDSLTAGLVSIYGEQWSARSLNTGDKICKGEHVKIVKNEGLTLFVEPL